MRKLFTFLILMLTAMAVNAASYNIWVKGIQVTDANKNDVLGDGKVMYDSANKYLEFIGANITASSTGTTKQARACVYVSQEVTVLIQGNVTMTGSGDYTPFIAAGGNAIKFTTRVGVESKANFTVKSATYRAMEFWGSNPVEFKMMNVNVTGGEYGIYAESNRQLKLTCCDFSVTGATNSAPIYGFNSITTEDTSISPKDLTYDTTSRYYKQGGKLYTGTVKFETEKYGIIIDGTNVTARNKKYILGDNNSQVSFDPELNELTLNNANLTTSDGIFINNSNKNTSSKTFKIKLIGTNKIVDSGYSSTLYIAPNSVDSTLIYSTSGGTLDVTANNKYATLACYIGKIAIKDCTIKLKNNHASGYALKGDKDATTKYSFINANISAESTGSDVLGDVYGLNYYGCYMKTPADAYLTNSQKMYSSSAGGSVKKLEIKAGKDDVKPFFFGNNDEITLTEVGTTSAKVSFDYCKDNFTKNENMKYHFFVAKEIINGMWAQSYDEDVYKGSSFIETEIKNLEPGTKYILRVRATDEAGNSVFYKDLEFTTKVENYSVIVCGTTLSSANLDDFKAQGLTYNPETKVITLDNANISYNAGAAIVVGLGDYTIDLKGKNTVKGSDTAIGVSLGSLIITTSSNGTLSCSSTNADAATISAPIGVLTIKGCTVDIYNNNGYGLSGGGLGGLKIDKANVKAYGKQGSVCDWTDFEMVNCYVDSPLRAEIGGTEKDKNLGIYLNGSPVKGQYVDIKAGANPHIVAPTLPSDANLKLSSTPWNITVEWNAASDNNTSAANLKYWVYVSTVKSNVTSEPWKKIMSAHDQDGAITGSGSTFKLTTQEYSEEINSVWGSMEPNTTFYVTVVVEDEDGNCALYNVGTVSTLSDADTTKPTLPADATISQSNLTHNSVELSWNAASDNITAPASLMYEISYAIKSTGTVVAQVYNTGDKTTTKLTGLLPETTYEVTMDVFDEAGNESYYEKLTFTTLEAPDETKPELPVDAEITASDITATSVKLSWTAATDDKTPADKIKYEIGYGIKDAMTGDVQYTTGTTSFEFTGLKPETTYEFNIAAVDEAGNFVEYATFSVTTLAEIDETAPALPADATITVKEAADNSLTLSWNAASDNKTGAEGLKYEININSDGSWKTVASLKGVTEYKIEGLEPGTSYKIMIFVSDESGNEASYDTLTTSTTGTNAIEAILAADPDVKMYNTSGVLVGKNYRGVVIINGKKYIKK